MPLQFLRKRLFASEPDGRSRRNISKQKRYRGSQFDFKQNYYVGWHNSSDFRMVKDISVAAILVIMADITPLSVQAEDILHSSLFKPLTMTFLTSIVRAQP